MISEDCSRIGFIAKPHGIHGEVLVRLDSPIADEIEPGGPMFVEFDGTLVPFFIESIRPAGDSALVKLEYTNNELEAAKLRGRPVYMQKADFEAEFIPGDTAFGYMGWQIMDEKSGFSGIISDFNNDVHNPLFIVDSDKGELLIPIRDTFINYIDAINRIIYMDLPDGLFEAQIP